MLSNKEHLSRMGTSNKPSCILIHLVFLIILYVDTCSGQHTNETRWIKNIYSNCSDDVYQGLLEKVSTCIKDVAPNMQTFLDNLKIDIAYKDYAKICQKFATSLKCVEIFFNNKCMEKAKLLTTQKLAYSAVFDYLCAENQKKISEFFEGLDDQCSIQENDQSTACLQGFLPATNIVSSFSDICNKTGNMENCLQQALSKCTDKSRGVLIGAVRVYENKVCEEQHTKTVTEEPSTASQTIPTSTLILVTIGVELLNRFKSSTR
ncbi:uncharacterized protein LOC106475198 [Limulus polyphemus]|uniref:Uncharacterized protein LOC106475198 n=1 Tax=Limulus polyphemus TaxID=6850 RepID=A0ABM1BZ06_LIMPO|nr:uncharacterized protein LOC106475198 [Limulus polyphemus]